MRLFAVLFALLGLNLTAHAEAPARFDYYVLSLSWTPNWCAEEGDRRRDARCAPGARFGWGLHGLWPQNEKGYPSHCRSPQRDPSRAETAAMGEIMGSSGLAWHQWRKHGRCSGLSAPAYFETSTRAFERVTLPKIFTELDRSVTLPAKVVEEAFLEANPGLRRDMVTVTCKARGIQEVRICLTKDLEPRRCGADTIRDCSLSNARLDPMR